jgi:ribonuclease BN (tRNA processing enzyme)
MDRSGVTDLELTILGCAGSHTGVGRACSGYLVRSGETHVLLDAGNGSTANLQRFVGFADLDAIVISHRHVDHCIDLVGAYYALKFGPGAGTRIPVYGAPEVDEALAGFMQRDTALEISDVYAFETVVGGDEIVIGPLRLSFADATHLTPAISTRIEVDGATLVYSGDTSGGPELVEIARGADLLLCEATWAGDQADYPPGIHLTGRAAAAIAQEAGVGRLVLTHVIGSTDREQVLAEAREVFDGPVELAEDLDVHHVAG